MFPRFYQVVDDFYPNPDIIRRKALERSFKLHEDVVGWRTEAYHPLGIKRLIEKRFRLLISYWEKDLKAVDACNGVFLSAFSRGRRAEKVGVHYDEPVDWMMFLVYLTPNAPREAGTSFWKHRETGLTCRPSRVDAKRLGVSVAQLESVLVRDTWDRSRWIEIDRIANIYNRAIMFPSGLLHSATMHFGNNCSNGRLYQSFHFPIEIR